MKKIKRQISIFVVCISLFFVVGSIVINTYASSYKYDWTKCGKADVTSEFLNKVSEICGRLGASPDDLMSVMAFESSLDHRTVNYGSGATGLIQFMPSTARGLGTTTAALKNMTAIRQLDYVYEYFRPYRGRISTLGDMYMAVLWPSGIGKSDNYGLFVKGTSAYRGNSALDINRDGVVTKAEAVSFVIAARDRYTAGGSPSSTPSSSTPHNPIGYLDVVEGGNGTITVKGWALDYDAVGTALNVHIYVGGPAGSKTIVASTGDVIANTQRTDVASVMGASVGNYHGFEYTFKVGITGTYPVYAYAINVGAKDSTNCNTLLTNSPKAVTIKAAEQVCSTPDVSFSDIAGGKQLKITAASGETIHYAVNKDGAENSGTASGSYTTTFSEKGNYTVSAYSSKAGCKNSGKTTKQVTVSAVETPTNYAKRNWRWCCIEYAE